VLPQREIDFATFAACGWHLCGSTLAFRSRFEASRALTRVVSASFNSIRRTGLSKRTIFEDRCGMIDIDTPDSVFTFIFD